MTQRGDLEMLTALGVLRIKTLATLERYTQIFSPLAGDTPSSKAKINSLLSGCESPAASEHHSKHRHSHRKCVGGIVRNAPAGKDGNRHFEKGNQSQQKAGCPEKKAYDHR
jgi:hypothetical protein